MPTDVSARLPVRVAVRCRPPSDSDGDPCVSVADGNVTVHSGEEEAAFSFDAVFPSDAAQHDVYSELVAAPMAALFDGFNCTILAYGQTGSGKSFSMMGPSEDASASPTHRARAAGIIPRFGAELFERASKVAGAKISVSYAQLYNEHFSDLLEPASTAELKLRRSEKMGVHVHGLSEKRVGSAKELLQLLAHAENYRVTAATRLNAGSSRSHAILTLALTMPARRVSTGGDGAPARGVRTVTSRANLVDLAGSERYKDAGAAAIRQQESISINQSLTTLGLVISTLAGGAGGAGSAGAGASQQHVPYRNSKLTHLLKESLGGSALCVMLCTVSPAVASLHESLSTLHFASRARAVVNTASRNVAVAAERERSRDRTPVKRETGGRSRDTTPQKRDDAIDNASEAGSRKGGPDMTRSLSPPVRANGSRRPTARPPRSATGGGTVGAGRSVTLPAGRALDMSAAASGGDDLDQASYSSYSQMSTAAHNGAHSAAHNHLLPPPPPVQLPGSPPLDPPSLHQATLPLGVGMGMGRAGGASSSLMDYSLGPLPASVGSMPPGGGSRSSSWLIERSATASALGEYVPSHLITHPFDGLGMPESSESSGAGGAWEAPEVAQLKERLRQVAWAAQRAEETRAQQARVHASEAQRLMEGERDKGAEIERLRWELDQQGEREVSRHKVSALQDEVRNFKTASAHKMQALEMQQLRERDVAMGKKLREAEDEVKVLRGAGEKRLLEVEGQRSREMETHERRIVKLMSVIEALTSAGDERTDMRVLAEKMNQLREVRELLEEEKAQVRAFQKRQRELLSGDLEGEREAHRRRVNELEAEGKMLRSLTQAQIDEVSQAHASELGAVQRRVSELEEERKVMKRQHEQRLADEKGKQYSDVQERERRRLAIEDTYKAQVAEANRAAAEAQQGMASAQASTAELMRQVQSQQREILSLQGEVATPRRQSLTLTTTTPLGAAPRHMGEATAMLERERDEHQRALRAAEEKTAEARAMLHAKSDEMAKAQSEHDVSVQKARAEAANERAIAHEAAEAERVASRAAMAGNMSAAITQAEERHQKEMERSRGKLRLLEEENGRLHAELEGALAELVECEQKYNESQGLLKAEKKRCVDIELRDLEAAEAREAEIEAEQAAKEATEHALAERASVQRVRVAMKFFRGAQERVGRLVFASWARYTKTQRLGAARERAAQLWTAAEDVKRGAELREVEYRRQLGEHDATVAESIGAMREEALRKQSALEERGREAEALRRELDAEREISEEAYEAQRLVEERAAGVQRKAAFRLFGLHTKRLEATVFIAWRNHVRAERKEHNAASELTAMLEAHELALAELEIQALDTKEKMSKRILKQLMGSLVQRLFASWARYATEQAARRDQMAEIANERRAAEAEQEALLEELAVSPLVHFKLRFAHPQPCVNAC